MIWEKNKNENVRKKYSTYGDNRIRLIMAIVFLLGLSIVYKLYELQFLKFDLYSSLASSQHKISSQLIPARGQIYISDYNKEKNSIELYPFATNKDFADIYAVPRDVKNPEDIAEKLYTIFKKENVEREVEALLIKEEKEKEDGELAALDNLSDEEKAIKIIEVKNKFANFKNDKTYLEYQEIKREKEIGSRKDNIIAKYLSILKKENDPYEPIENKVDEEKLKILYALLASDSSQEVNAENLELREGKIFYKNDQDLNNTESEKELVISGVGFQLTNYRYYPEKNIGAHILGFVRNEKDVGRGYYGLEGFFNDELFGKYGSIKTEQSADNNALILNDSEYINAESGSNLILTINRSIQFAVCNKLKEAVRRHGADGGSVVIINPNTGEIIAMCSEPDYDPNYYEEAKNMNTFNNPAIFSQYEPGSIFKAITMAMGLDQDKVKPDTTYNDTGVYKVADYEIKNSDKKANGVVSMVEVLEKSLNTGAIYVMNQIGPEKFLEYIKNFGFGEKTGIELEGESKGDIINLNKEKGKVAKELNSATASFGQGIAVTPLQMVYAFGAIANGGTLMKPYIVKEVIKADGTKVETQPQTIRRVISERAATLLGGMLVEVVENGHGKKAGVQGYYVGGKTGTAQVARKDGRGYEVGAHIGSFAGYAPVNNPKFAMLVRIDRPRDVEWAESSAAPLFGEIAEYLLNYYQVPKER